MHLEELVADINYSVSQDEHHLLVFCSSFIYSISITSEGNIF